jgi:hypothetical protein
VLSLFDMVDEYCLTIEFVLFMSLYCGLDDVQIELELRIAGLDATLRGECTIRVLTAVVCGRSASEDKLRLMSR